MGVEHKGANGAAPHPYAIGADPALTAAVRKEILDTLRARTKIDPAVAESELDARDMPAEFVRRFADLGLLPDNLPDLLAGNLIAMWRVVHEAEAPAREVAEALSRQFAQMIAGSPQAADPAKRQLMGEALMYEAVLTLEAFDAAREAGNAKALHEMAETAQRNILAQRSINLRKTKLTNRGMVRA